MLALDPVVQVALPGGDSTGPARLLVDTNGRAAVYKPDEPIPLWKGRVVNLDEQPRQGPWNLRTATGDALTATRFEGCRCQYGDLLSRGERDLQPLDIPA